MIKVVVADDDVFNLEILKKDTEDCGMQCTEFPDGDDTLEYLLKHPDEVDIVILDKMMPRMDGLTVIKKMKEHASLKDIPVIIQTGEVSSEKVQEALDAGASCCLCKPFKPEHLTDAIKEILS